MSMTFRYKKVDRPAPLGPTVCPVILITLKGSKRQQDVLALLDSGADTFAMPIGIAEFIGLDLKGKKEPIKGIGGEVAAINTNMNVMIGRGHENYCFSVVVAVIDDKEMEDDFPVIIGREGFFDNFHITFKENEKKVILKKCGVT
jgi:hypothetical protein